MDIGIIESYKNHLLNELKMLKKLDKKYTCFKDGTFIYICHQNGRSKWFQSDGKNHKYISKSDRDKAQRLATVKYVDCRIGEITRELAILDRLVECEVKSNSILTDPMYVELLDSQIVQFYKGTDWNRRAAKSKEIQQAIDLWVSEPYIPNPYHPEKRTHKSITGNILRSKAEALIDTMLSYEGIPFKYECPLELIGGCKYPDFTILHPVTGKIYYWEHFGWSDDPQYVEKNMKKMFEYAQNGIIVGKNLICTYETADNPLSPDTVQKMIDMYLK